MGIFHYIKMRACCARPPRARFAVSLISEPISSNITLSSKIVKLLDKADLLVISKDKVV